MTKLLYLFSLVLLLCLIALIGGSSASAAVPAPSALAQQPPPCVLFGDFIEDGEIDVADIMQVANKWRCKCGDGCYGSRYDIDNDCDVDIVDIMRIVVRWGDSCENPLPPVEVCGSISQDTTWTTGNVYLVTCDITVNSGVTLTVQRGVVVKFSSGKWLAVNGSLLSQGMDDYGVVFTSWKDDYYGGDTNSDGAASLPSAMDWGGLWLGPSDNVSLDHAIVRYGGSQYYYNYESYQAAIYNYIGNLSITNSTIAYNGPYGVYTTGGSAVITNSQVVSHTSRGVHARWTSLAVTGSTISDSGYGIYVYHPEEPVTLTDNVFTNNTYDAIYLYFENDGPALTLSGNTASGNRINGIGLSGLVTTMTLPAGAGLPYVVEGLMTVNSDATLTIQAGAVVKFDTSGSLTTNGTLQAQGTSGSPVVFTSVKDDAYGGDTNNDGSATSPAAGDWYGLYVASMGNVTLDHAIVRYGIVHYGGYYYGGIYNDGGNLSIANSTIAHNGPYGVYSTNGSPVITHTQVMSHSFGGVYIRFYGGPIAPILRDNIFTANGGAAIYISAGLLTGNATITGNTGSGNGSNGIWLSATITGTTTLASNPNLPYIVSSLYVPFGQSLTLQAGTVLKFDTSGSLTTNGTLQAQGTSGSPVVFTSLKDDSYGGDTNNDGSATSPAAGDWYGLYVASTGNVTLDHAIVRYGIVHCGGYYYGGIYNDGGNLSIANSTIAHNGLYGVYQQSGGSSTIRNSNIYGHSAYGVYNADTNTAINAENNYWGSDSGPAPYGSGNGINYNTCYDNVNKVYYICQFYVDADPWLGKEVFVQSQLGQSGPAATYQARVAEPVNTANGNYSYSHTDLSIPTRGLPLDFTQAYNSLDPQQGPLGWGWTHNWNLCLRENPDDGSVVVTFRDGHAEKWTWTGTAYDGIPGVFGTLVKNGDDSFDLTQKDKTCYHFNPNGHLTWAEDKSGNRTTLTYDAQGRLAAVTEPRGRTLTLAYTSPVSATLISQVTDPAGHTVQFTYNVNGELTTVTDVMGHATTMTYDANHRLLTVTDANSHTFVRDVYDGRGRVTEQYDALNNKTTFAYDEPAHKTLVTDPRGNITTYQYDSEWRLTSQKDPLNHTASYAYDADNNLTQVTDKRGNTTYYAYDDRGNVLVITDTLAFTRTFTYDDHNNLLSQTDARRNSTTYEYDAHSNLIHRADALDNVTTWTYDTYGQMLSTVNARGNVTQYGYDAYGHQIVITDALSNITTFTYDIAGRKLSKTDPLGRITTYTYDAANRLLTISEPLGKVTAYTYDPVGNRISITDPRGGVTAFTCDDKDRLVSVSDPLGHTMAYGYDAVDNQTVITDALGHATIYTYDALNRRTSVTDPLGNTTSCSYDANGNRTSLTDANGNVTQYSYDVLNRLISVTDAEGGTVTYAYDAAGNRTAMTDANSHTTIYAYDALNRLVSVTDPLSHTVAYAYDAVGNRISQTKADGTVISYDYDALDRLVDITAPGLNIGYAYDAVGNRTAMTDTVGVTSCTYDDLNRLTQVAGPNGTLSYSYDLNDNRTNLTYPDSQVVTYTYDLADRLTAVTDWDSHVTAYTYDDANRQTVVQYPNNTGATYTYDDADRLLSIVHTSSVSGTIAVFTYTLDAVGNRLTMQDLDGTTTYAYDDLYRLTQVTYPDSEAITYAYDPMGNRTAMTSTVSGAVTYTYDAADRLLTISDGTTFTWDANGNMISKGSATYTFNALDRLTQVVSSTTMVQFAYNGDGVRLSKTVNGVNTQYVQDVGISLPVVLAETTAGQTNQYIYGRDLMAQVDPGGDLSFCHHDGLGSTWTLSNQAGQRTDTYSYDAFGAVRSHVGSAVQLFKFAGEQMDSEAGLVNLRMRYYDPEVGRFITRDQFEGFRDGTQSRNRYVYVENNPVSRVDPSGLTWQIYSGLEGGFMLGPIKIGGRGKLGLEFNDGLPEAYLSGAGGPTIGAGLDVSLGPKVGIAYEGSGGISFLPEWLQIKGGKLKLPFSEVGGKITREEFKIDIALRTGVGVAFEPQVGIEAKRKSGNLIDRLSDWIFDWYYQPRIGAGGGAGGADGAGRGSTAAYDVARWFAFIRICGELGDIIGHWGGPPSGGK